MFISNTGYSKYKLYGRQNRLARNLILHELYLRFQHNQFYIEAKQGVIAKLLDGNYQQEFTALAMKLLKHCNQINAANTPPIECPAGILKINVLDKLIRNKIAEKNKNFPALMSEEDNKAYRELIEDVRDDEYHDFGI